MAGQTVAEAVGEQLAREGAQVVFGLMGSGNLVVTNALVAGGARFFAARHENGAVGMADGYARTTGGVGFASVHQGPGLTNTLTALTEAAKSRTPLVVLAGETPAAALGSNFRIDQHDLVESVGAAAERVHSAATARADATRAAPARAARAAPGRPDAPDRHPGAARAARAARPPRRRARSWRCPRRRTRRRSTRSRRDWRRRSGRSSSAGAGRSSPRRGRRCGGSRSAMARCWRRARSRTASSPATPTTSASPAGSRRRWPPSCSRRPT